MRDYHWTYCAVLLGCLGASLLAVPSLGQIPETPGAAQSEPSKDHPPQPALKEPEDLSIDAPNESASVDKNEVGDGAESNDHPEGYYQDEDLKAQRLMAEATESIVSLTRIQIALGVIGTIALVWTLFESRRATNLASRTARRELRAYVSGRPEFVFSFDNASLARARYKICLLYTSPSPRD